MKRLLLILLSLPVFAKAQIITTIAGTGALAYGGDGGPAIIAQLRAPAGIILDHMGNVFFADMYNSRIRKIDTAGIISTIAGNGIGGYIGDGVLATAAEINYPSGLAFDGLGNMYIADVSNQRIRKIDTFGIITTVAGNGIAGYGGDGNPATNASLNLPKSVCVDSSGNIYIADLANNRIRKVTASGIITTIAGDGTAGFYGDGGPATASKLNNPYWVASWHGDIYIADRSNYRVRKIDGSGIITTCAGSGSSIYGGDGGPAAAAGIWPNAVYVDSPGFIYVSDLSNRVRRIDPITNIITTIAGSSTGGYGGDNCDAASARINLPFGVVKDNAGSLYISDYSNNRIRKLSLNHAPIFTGGPIQSMTVCKNVTDSINSLLGITDADTSQTETWSAVALPAHGTLVASCSRVSTTSTVLPTGLSYTPVASYVGSDTFTVMVTDCGNNTDTTTIYVTVADCALSASLHSSFDKITIYPNPTNNLLHILTPGKINSFTITNSLGQRVYSQQYNSSQVQVDVADLPAGMYIIKINGSEVRKFVKQ